MKNIAVIGAGTMGNGIAHVFAMNGYSVNLIDISEEALDKALDTITKNLDRMLKKERITEEVKQKTLGNLTKQTDLKTGCHRAGRPQAENFQGSGRGGTEVCHPGDQYFFHFHHQDCGSDNAPGASHRHALHEPRASHEAGRGHPRLRHFR